MPHFIPDIPSLSGHVTVPLVSEQLPTPPPVLQRMTGNTPVVSNEITKERQKSELCYSLSKKLLARSK